MHTMRKIMKGVLYKTEQGWVVKFKNHDGRICSIPLHPTDLGIPSHVKNILGEVQEVEFEIVEGCCTPEDQIKRYINCRGCDKKQYYAKVIQDNPATVDSTALVDKQEVDTMLAKEDLFTEKQVRQAMFEAYVECENGNNFFNVQDKIIQSLKQSKL